MEEILGSKTAIRLFHVLMSNPLSVYLESSLIKEAAVGKGSAAKAIDKLGEESYAIVRRVGKNKIIKFNPRNEAALLLKQAFDVRRFYTLPSDVVAAVLLLREKARPHIGMMVLFGSQITGNATVASDIDLLIIAGKEKEVIEKAKEVEVLINRKLHLHLYKEYNPEDAFVRGALLQGIAIAGYEAVQDCIREFLAKNSEAYIRSRVEWLIQRIGSALRNYMGGDPKTASGLLDNVLKRLEFLGQSERNNLFIGRGGRGKAVQMLKDEKFLKGIKTMGTRQKLKALQDFLDELYLDAVIGEWDG